MYRKQRSHHRGETYRYRYKPLTIQIHLLGRMPVSYTHLDVYKRQPLLDAYKLQEPGLPEKAELENQAWITRPETAICVRGAEHIDFKH